MLQCFVHIWVFYLCVSALVCVRVRGEECVCDLKALSLRYNGVFDKQLKGRLCLVTPHSVVNARHSCHSSLYALRQATGLSGIPLFSICLRTPLNMSAAVCVSEENSL